MIVAAIDWRSVFVPTVSLAELFLRGSIMYLFILALMRVFRREAGSISIADLLVIVLVADAAQYHSVTEAVVLVGTIFLWNVALDWLSFRYRFVYRLLHSKPLPLVTDGRILRRNLKTEMFTVDDLMSQLREQGIGDVKEVKLACVEPDGHLSVIKFKRDEEHQGQPDRRRGLA
jgi:uncharacterized membrane protein YcaP (DUF421 family)